MCLKSIFKEFHIIFYQNQRYYNIIERAFFLIYDYYFTIFTLPLFFRSLLEILRSSFLDDWPVGDLFAVAFLPLKPDEIHHILSRLPSSIRRTLCTRGLYHLASPGLKTIFPSGMPASTSAVDFIPSMSHWCDENNEDSTTSSSKTSNSRILTLSSNSATSSINRQQCITPVSRVVNSGAGLTMMSATWQSTSDRTVLSGMDVMFDLFFYRVERGVRAFISEKRHLNLSNNIHNFFYISKLSYLNL